MTSRKMNTSFGSAKSGSTAMVQTGSEMETFIKTYGAGSKTNENSTSKNQNQNLKEGEKQQKNINIQYKRNLFQHVQFNATNIFKQNGE